jgi:hypothetical protein
MVLVAFRSAASSWWRNFRARSRSEQLVWLAVASLLLFGAFLRTRGYLWNVVGVDVDEASWARRLIQNPMQELLIRPPLFMGITKVLVQLFGPWESVLRFVSWSLGLFLLFASPALAARLFGTAAARLFFVTVVALHPAAIDMAKEFKPYSPSLAVHLLLIWLALRYAALRRDKDLWWVLALAPLSVLMAQDIAILYPGLYLSLLISAIAVSRRHLVLVFAGGALTVLTLVGLYFFIWRQMDLGPSGGDTAFWARKYGTFYVEGSGTSHLDWFGQRVFDMMSFPGIRIRLWRSELLSSESLELLSHVDSWMWTVLVALGTLTLALRRRLRLALLLLLPLITLCAINRAGLWPLGAFRTNLFLLVYTAALAGLAVDELCRRFPRSLPLALVPSALLVFLPFVAFESTWHASKRIFSESSAFPRALRRLLERQGANYQGPPETVILDNRTCTGWKFYTQLHPGTLRWLPKDLDKRLSTYCRNTLSSKFVRGVVHEEGKRVWLMANAGSSIRSYEEGVPGGLVVTERIELRYGGDLTDLVLAFEPK